MGIDITRVINSSLGVRLAFALGQGLPRRLGYSIADFAAGWLTKQKSSAVVRAVRSNQWVISGESLAREALDQAVRETLQHTAHSIFDLYHFINNHEKTARQIVLDANSQQLTQRPEFDGRGLMIVGLHLSNFDLVLQWLCRDGMKPMVLTIPDPQGGRRMEFEMRKKTGMNLVPASMTALRQAIRHLQQGGMVLTGIDRPIANPEAHPRFFGRPASLPMHHILLATKARVPVMIMVTNIQADGKYHVLTSGPIEMESDSGREGQLLHNAENVLHIAEDFIRRAPQQWGMSLPVWPEMLEQMPDSY